ncbi:MAG: hypothetical protein M0Z71_14755 [Nitrospiraceae bacterium]|nr:hypothetical protein [Nitrospiraceae bacterium]
MRVIEAPGKHRGRSKQRPYFFIPTLIISKTRPSTSMKMLRIAL